MIKLYNLLNQNNNPQKEASTTFAHNWMDNIDSLMQLLLSEQIWKRQESDPDKAVMISKRRMQPKEGLTYTVFYLDDDPVLLLSKSMGDVEDIPLHYTICV